MLPRHFQRVPEPWRAENSFVRAARLGSLWCSAKVSLEYLQRRVFSNCPRCPERWGSGFSHPSDQPASRGTKHCFREARAHKFTPCDHKKQRWGWGGCGEGNFTGRKIEWRCLCVTLYLLCCYQRSSAREAERRQKAFRNICLLSLFTLGRSARPRVLAYRMLTGVFSFFNLQIQRIPIVEIFLFRQNSVPLKIRYSCPKDDLLFAGREGETIRKAEDFLIIKDTRDSVLLSRAQSPIDLLFLPE